MKPLLLRVLVCDDEMMARKRILRLLGETGLTEVVTECQSGAEVLARLAEGEYDVAILDIDMPDMSGLELTGKMQEVGVEQPYVVFLTAHPEHAVQAFDVGAIDYMMKPVDGPRVEKALARASNFQEEVRSGAGAGAGAGLPAKLAVPTKNGVVLLAPQDVTHAVFDGALVTIHTRDRHYLTDFTLADLEAKLTGGPFERVHRRSLLNLEATERLEPVASGGYTAFVAGGKPVDVSRQAARKLRRWLGIT